MTGGAGFGGGVATATAVSARNARTLVICIMTLVEIGLWVLEVLVVVLDDVLWRGVNISSYRRFGSQLRVLQP
jgi:hypothetical protein